MRNIVKNYDLEKLVEVAQDRADDYSNIKREHEETYVGECEDDPNKCYPFGFGDNLDKVVELLTRLQEKSENSTESILVDVDEELVSVLKERIDCLVESHLDCWRTRYEDKDEEDVSFDLNVNHDPSNEFDLVEEWLGRKLTADEEQVVVSFFNESVLDKLFNR